MLKIENAEVVGWEHAIRGMRNPMNSWERSDSQIVGCDGVCDVCPIDCGTDRVETAALHGGDSLVVGPNDHDLMTRLAKAGPVHAKYRRMIVVYLDITAPLYWWKEFDTYKVGTVANSCSTMHKISDKEFTMDDFSHEHLVGIAKDNLDETLVVLNHFRKFYLKTKEKSFWWQMIQLLPSSYNQKRTVMLNYEVLTDIYRWRRDHKLDEWQTFCDWIEKLPYSEIITGKEE